MKCKYCHSDIEKGSLYCRFCGSRLFNARKKEIAVPKPRILADGRYTAQIMVDGKRCSVYGTTEAEYEANARAVKAKLISAKEAKTKLTLRAAMNNYISANTNVLSPSTIRGYNTIARNRFSGYKDKSVDDINWQMMINDEAENVGAKTIRNSWGLVTASLSFAKKDIPEVNLPAVEGNELDFLDYPDIQKFLEAVKGDECEFASLLALHSLRESEFLALSREDIRDGFIYVSKAKVPDSSHRFVIKNTTKTKLSNRVIPVMIPRLLEILPDSGQLVTLHPSSLRRRINNVCKKAGLKQIGYHGLRRSFASLGYHLKWSERTLMSVGGWSNMQTVHKLYVKLSRLDVNDDIQNMRNYYGFTKET